MHNQKRSSKQEMQAMYVSITGNLFFVFAELFMYIYTRSQAVLMDAVYDGVEFFMLLPSVFLIPYLYRPLNEKHPFGYTQIESLLSCISEQNSEFQINRDGNRRLENRWNRLFWTYHRLSHPAFRPLSYFPRS